MPWARVDDGWWCHPKVMGLDNAACGLWISALCWSTMHEGEAIPPAFLVMVNAEEEHMGQLVAAGMATIEPGGWRLVPWEQIAPPSRRPHIPDSIRHAVYARDNWTCVSCGARTDLTLDHIHPYSFGGPDTVENLQAMCRSCNSKKGDTIE